MRTFVAGLAFIMPFSLVHQMVKDRLDRNISGWKKKLPSVTGFLAGIAVPWPEICTMLFMHA